MSKKGKKRHDLDVVILTAGNVTTRMLRNCLDSIRNEIDGIDANVVIVRNGIPEESKDEYRELLKYYPYSVIVQDNKGYASGANRGIRYGNSDLVLFVSDDIVLGKGSVAQMMKTMQDETIGICGMKLLFPPDSEDPGRPAGKVQHVGHAIDIRGEIVHPLLGWSPENPKCCVSRDCISVTGAAFMIRRSAFNRVGGFFEGFGMGYFEDVDLCLGIHKIGMRVHIDAAAIGYHYAGASFSKNGKSTPQTFEANKMLLRQRKGNMFFNDNWTYY